MTFMEWIFGSATLASLIIALIVYFSQRANIFGLIEKLRASRNNLYILDRDSQRVFRIIDSNELNDTEKLVSIRQIAHSIHENMPSMTNTIDDGNEWGNLSIKNIHKLICK